MNTTTVVCKALGSSGKTAHLLNDKKQIKSWQTPILKKISLYQCALTLSSQRINTDSRIIT